MLDKNILLDDLEAEEQELYEHVRLVVDKGQQPLRIDKFLMNRLENKTRTKIQSAADAGNILVNAKPVKSNYKVKPDDVISVVLAHPPRTGEIIPENIPLNIVYEDDDVIVVNKPAGLVVHPGYGNYSGTLVNALMYHFMHLPLFQQKDMRPGLVHRIDKNTSGLLLIAKNEYAMAHLAKQFFNHSTHRRYWAVAWGTLKEKQGTITANLARDVRDRKKMAVFADPAIGKHAITHYKVIEELHYLSLVECALETGRTHQIRVHFQHIGHSIFNDEVYGGDTISKGNLTGSYQRFVQNNFTICPRHALHAKELGFVHPTTKEYMEFHADLPADMKELLDRWRNYNPIISH